MPMSGEEDEVLSWADELIDDEFTAVNSHQTICFDSTNDSKSLQKHFSLHLNNHYLYGILTGFNFNTSNEEYCRKIFFEVFSYFPLELSERINSLQLNNNQDKCYELILNETFNLIEQSIKKHMDEILSEKTALELSLSDKDPTQFPLIQKKLNTYSEKLSFGLKCLITIINNDKIYVANIGDTKAIVCIVDENNIVQSKELSTCHDLTNVKELERLQNVSIDTELLKLNNKIGNMTLTRCLGNLKIKNFYKNYSDLSSATSDPILSKPTIDSFCIDESFKFLILLSVNLFIQPLQQCYDDENFINHLLTIINDKINYTDIDLKNIPDLVLKDIFQNYESFHSKPILLIRMFNKFNDLNEKKDKTVITPEIMTNDNKLINNNDNNNTTSTTMLKQESEEIPSYVDFTPLIEALKNNDIDYDSF